MSRPQSVSNPIQGRAATTLRRGPGEGMQPARSPAPGYRPPLAERVALALRQSLILAGLASIALPIVWMAITAVKLPRDVYSLDAALVFTPTFDNFRTVFAHPWNLGNKIANSILVAAGTVVVAVPMATLAAYAFSRFDFRFRQTIFLLVIASQFIPAAVVVLPYFLMFRDLGLLDTRTALVLINLSIVLPYAVWMIKGFIDAVPIEIEESAMIDGPVGFACSPALWCRRRCPASLPRPCSVSPSPGTSFCSPSFWASRTRSRFLWVSWAFAPSVVTSGN